MKKLISEESIEKAQKKFENKDPMWIFGFYRGINFAETEIKGVLLELIESIFTYERENLDMINSYDRTPESVLETFIKNRSK
jgi:hypothetical protein